MSFHKSKSKSLFGTFDVDLFSQAFDLTLLSLLFSENGVKITVSIFKVNIHILLVKSVNKRSTQLLTLT